MPFRLFERFEMKKTRFLVMLGILLVMVQAMVSVVALYRIKRFDVLVTRYLILLVFALLLAVVIVIGTQFFNIANIVGDVVSVAVIIALIWVANSVHATEKAIENIAPKNTVDIMMNVIVVRDAGFTDVKDLAGKTVGISKVDEDTRDYCINAAKKMRSDLGDVDIPLNEYDDELTMAQALLHGDVSALIVNSANVGMIDDIFSVIEEGEDGYLGKREDGIPVVFTDMTEVLTSYTITVDAKETNQVKPNGNNSSNNNDKPKEDDREIIDTAVTPFLMFVSGIDTEGDISTIARSDVNVIVCVNPVTKMIGLITTPRDSYVEIPGVTDGSGFYDKLTHAGIFSAQCQASIAALEKLYGIDVDYYMKLNFTSMRGLVDALGGVSVYSKYEFDSKNILGVHFNQGYNQVNGEEALIFCRERYSFPDGDYQRGRNHLEMIKAIFNKALSPALLANYSEILSKISANVETNMTQGEITNLVKMQLDDKASWNIVTYAAYGINGGRQQLRHTYTAKQYLRSVTILDEDSVACATEMMERILNGEIVTEEQLNTRFGKAEEKK